MSIPSCPTCSGSMSLNENKLKSTSPDYICDDSECKNEKGFRSSAWKSKPRSAAKTVAVQTAPPVPTVSLSVWEAKDRLSAAQTSINAAAAIFQGSGDLDAVLTAAPHLYDFLRQAKLGILPKPTKSTVGRKVAEAMQEEVTKKEEVTNEDIEAVGIAEKEINVDDIPF